MDYLILPIGAGLFVGFLIGMTGMGGGALMTPFLLLVMGLDPVLAVGTDLMFAAITKIFGGLKHRREDNVRIRNVLWMACGSLPAAILGAQFILRQTENRYLIEVLLPTLLGIVLVLVSLIMGAKLLGFLSLEMADEPRWPSPLALISIGAVGGLLVGMTSVGGGTVIMALLLIFYTVPIKYLVGLDVMHGALLAGVAALAYAFSGSTDWQLVGLLLIGSLPGVWLGARAVSYLNPRLVRAVLAILILGAGLDLLF